MSKKSTDTRFMVLFTIVGVVIFVLSNSAISNIPKDCTSNFIRDGLTTVSIVSAVLLTIGIAYVICNYGLPFSNTAGHDCYVKKKDDSVGEMYMSVSAFFSASMMIILLIMGIKLHKGTCEISGYNPMLRKLKFYIWSMFGLCVMVFGLSIFGLWYTISHIPVWAKEKSATQAPAPKSRPNNFLQMLMGNNE